MRSARDEIKFLCELFEPSMDDERRDNSENNVSPRIGIPGGKGRGHEPDYRIVGSLSISIARKMGDIALRKFPLVLLDGRQAKQTSPSGVSAIME